MTFKQLIIQALEDRYNAQISEAEATLKIYFEKPVGIGEHPQIIEEMDKLVHVIADMDGCLAALNSVFVVDDEEQING